MTFGHIIDQDPGQATAGLTTPADNSRPVHGLIWSPANNRHGLPCVGIPSPGMN